MVYRKKGTPEEETTALTKRVSDIASLQGGRLLSLRILDINQMIDLECAKSHSFSLLCRSVIYKDSWCPFCTRGMIYSQDEAAQRLRPSGFKLLSNVSVQKDDVIAECLVCGEQLQAEYGMLLKRQTLCTCQLDIQRRISNTKRVEEYVRKRNGTLIDPRPLAQKEFVTVECDKRHQWDVIVGSLLFGKTWCPECSSNKPRSLDELAEIVASRGGKLKTLDYRGVDGTYQFECSLGHEFSNMFKKVEKGQWCPICSRGSKSEEVARTTLEQLLGKKFPRKRPKWLRNSRGYQMELDGFSEDLSVAFEYQGYQHFESDHWGTDLASRKKDDELKKVLCRAHGVILLELTFRNEYEQFPKEIMRQLKLEGFDLSKYDFSKKIDLSKAYIREDRLLELRDLLANKGIEVLSNAWLGVGQKYRLRCTVCETIWEAKGNSFFNSRRVAGCDYCNRRTPANKQDMSSLIEFAKSHGGKVLSTEYVRRNHKYMWECSKGHIFEGNLNYMKDKSRFCFECEGWQKKSTLTGDEAHAEFLGYGFELREPFTQRSRNLKTTCLKCSYEGFQVLDKLRAGTSNCKGCKLREQEATALRLFAQANIRPLGPFEGRSLPWRSECLKCHSIVSPRASDLERGQGGCKFCGRLASRKKPEVTGNS
jgi:hypothetical protein